MKSWLDFWNAPNAIYAGSRHQRAHSAKVLAGVSGFVPSGGESVVLDWGCGDAVAADELAQSCGTLLLFEPAPTTRNRLVARYAGHPKIEVLDDATLETVASGSVDLIVVNSVVQYLSRQQFADALRLFRRLLKSDGKLLLGDIIEPDTPMLRHVMTFLGFAWQNGFFLAGILSLARNLTSPYCQLRRSAGYACYRVVEMLAVLEDSGFVGERLPSNIAVSQLRSSYLARKRDPGP
jgi:cyclopropane fatty-acyl-phospholipid synthase-like methyltransferase